MTEKGRVRAMIGRAGWGASIVTASVLGLWLSVLGTAPPPDSPGDRESSTEAELRAQRERLVEQVRASGVTDPVVLAALRAVPRHWFVPLALRGQAYEDIALPIAAGQTISQPSVVALMTARIRPRPGLRVLEIGTGSGYQAAVLAQCVTPGGTVDSIEIVPELGRQAEALLRELGYRNVHVRIGDGYGGWPEHAPFDAIVLTAAPQRVPQPLLDQLKLGGRLVAPVGRDEQQLLVITRTEQGLSTEVAADVRFVPMTGRAQAGH
jgi:protein-L-isoaspartate(D-aspartate) O-methyltransferase